MYRAVGKTAFLSVLLWVSAAWALPPVSDDYTSWGPMVYQLSRLGSPLFVTGYGAGGGAWTGSADKTIADAAYMQNEPATNKPTLAFQAAAGCDSVGPYVAYFSIGKTGGLILKLSRVSAQDGKSVMEQPVQVALPKKSGTVNPNYTPTIPDVMNYSGAAYYTDDAWPGNGWTNTMDVARHDVNGDGIRDFVVFYGNYAPNRSEAASQVGHWGVFVVDGDMSGVTPATAPRYVHYTQEPYYKDTKNPYKGLLYSKVRIVAGEFRGSGNTGFALLFWEVQPGHVGDTVEKYTTHLIVRELFVERDVFSQNKVVLSTPLKLREYERKPDMEGAQLQSWGWDGDLAPINGNYLLVAATGDESYLSMDKIEVPIDTWLLEYSGGGFVIRASALEKNLGDGWLKKDKINAVNSMIPHPIGGVKNNMARRGPASVRLAVADIDGDGQEEIAMLRGEYNGNEYALRLDVFTLSNNFLQAKLGEPFRWDNGSSYSSVKFDVAAGYTDLSLPYVSNDLLVAYQPRGASHELRGKLLRFTPPDLKGKNVPHLTELAQFSKTLSSGNFTENYQNVEIAMQDWSGRTSLVNRPTVVDYRVENAPILIVQAPPTHVDYIPRFRYEGGKIVETGDAADVLAVDAFRSLTLNIRGSSDNVLRNELSWKAEAEKNVSSSVGNTFSIGAKRADTQGLDIKIDAKIPIPKTGIKIPLKGQYSVSDTAALAASQSAAQYVKNDTGVSVRTSMNSVAGDTDIALKYDQDRSVWTYEIADAFSPGETYFHQIDAPKAGKELPNIDTNIALMNLVSWQPVHQPGNLFSYPTQWARISDRESSLLDGPKSVILGLSAGTGKSLQMDWSQTFATTEGATLSTSNGSSEERSSSIGLYFVSQNKKGTYTRDAVSEQASSVSSSMKSSKGLTSVIPPMGQEAFGAFSNDDNSFRFATDVYRLNDSGAAELGNIVDLRYGIGDAGSDFTPGENPTASILWYGKDSPYQLYPDPGLNLPGMLKYQGGKWVISPKITAARVKGLFIEEDVAPDLYPARFYQSLPRGVDVRIKVRIYNFSFRALDKPLKVEFFVARADEFRKPLDDPKDFVKIGETTVSSIPGWSKAKGSEPNWQWATIRWKTGSGLEGLQSPYYLLMVALDRTLPGDPQNRGEILEVHEFGDLPDNNFGYVDFNLIDAPNTEAAGVSAAAGETGVSFQNRIDPSPARVGETVTLESVMTFTGDIAADIPEVSLTLTASNGKGSWVLAQDLHPLLKKGDTVAMEYSWIALPAMAGKLQLTLNAKVGDRVVGTDTAEVVITGGSNPDGKDGSGCNAGWGTALAGLLLLCIKRDIKR